jgi:hypothetical protein
MPNTLRNLMRSCAVAVADYFREALASTAK